MKMYDDTKFKNIESGEIWSYEEIKEAYDQFKDEMRYDSVEEWIDELLSLGRQGIGGMVEV